MKKILGAILVLCFLAAPAFAAIHTETIEYEIGNQVFEGFLAYDDAVIGKRPGVVIVHDWMGFGANQDHRRAEMLAQLGYIALSIDIYGKGTRPKDTAEASALAGKYKENRALLRERVLAGFNTLKSLPLTDPMKLAAMGYCFGGTTVLELARSGADVAGVVSFHGGLNTPTPEDAKNIKAKVLILHGADDPYVPDVEVKTFQKEMNDANIDWQMVYYSGAVHSFTEPEAGTDNSKGAAYNPKADARSWEAMKVFFEEIFQ